MNVNFRQQNINRKPAFGSSKGKSAQEHANLVFHLLKEEGVHPGKALHYINTAAPVDGILIKGKSGRTITEVDQKRLLYGLSSYVFRHRQRIAKLLK